MFGIKYTKISRFLYLDMFGSQGDGGTYVGVKHDITGSFEIAPEALFEREVVERVDVDGETKGILLDWL